MNVKSPARISRKSNPRSTARGVMFEPLEDRRLMTSVVVNTTVDAIFPPTTGLISLRSAIATANASTSPTTITFSPTVFATPETILLDGNQLELSNTAKATTITGPAVGLAISGNNASTDFEINTNVTATLTNLTITKAADSGIINNGILTLTNDSISGNTNPNSAPDSHSGGGISDYGTATLTDVTIADNTDLNGDFSSAGGLFVSGGTATLTNVTLFGNSDNSLGGGGVYLNGGTATLTNVTISGNSATNLAGGVYVDPSSVLNISNTIIANNTATNGDPDVYGNFASIGYNLIGKTDGSSGFNTLDLTGTVAKPLSAKLGMLANNGGPTETLLPGSGSPAIGAGLVAYVPKGITTDQRGLPRIVNGKVDIGAVEVQSAVTTTLTVTPPAAQTATVGASQSFNLGSFTETNATGPYTVTVAWGDGTANTTIKMTAAGTIPATVHTYAKTGSDTVSVTVTDSASHTSNKATFAVTVSPVASTGVISGTVFNDANGDKKLDDGELGLGGYVVFIDLKGTGKFVTGDPTVTTAYNGAWSFTALAAGTYKVLVEPVTIATQTTPTLLTITLKAGGTSTGNLFGEKAIA